jgi:hypothetical protein
MPKRSMSGPDTKSRVSRPSTWVTPEKTPKKEARAFGSLQCAFMPARKAKSTKCFASTPKKPSEKRSRR